jgi:hypothetical protein
MSHLYDDDDEGLGEVLNYSTPPIVPRAVAPTTPYNTVSDDERATSGSEQPKKEWSIWDSVAKPHLKARAPTHKAARHSSAKQKPTMPPRRATSSNRTYSDNYPADASVGSNQAPQVLQVPQVPEPRGGVDSSFLWIAGGVLLLVLVMRSKG